MECHVVNGHLKSQIRTHSLRHVFCFSFHRATSRRMILASFLVRLFPNLPKSSQSSSCVAVGEKPASEPCRHRPPPCGTRRTSHVEWINGPIWSEVYLERAMLSYVSFHVVDQHHITANQHKSHNCTLSNVYHLKMLKNKVCIGDCHPTTK